MTGRALRVGVVGAGKIGGYHSRILSKMPGVQLVGVCDVNLWRAQLVGWRCGTVAYRNHLDLLRQVDAAVIAVPTQLHFAVSKAALEGGVHVLIEKPIAASVEEAPPLHHGRAPRAL